MLRTIYLHGALGRKFGWRHKLAVETPFEAITALSALRKGFREYFWKEEASYTFVRGSTLRAGHQLDEAEVCMTLGREDFHIIPAACGSGGGGGGKGAAKIIIGVVAIAAAVFTMGASLAAYGAAGAAGAAASSLGGAAAAGAAASGAAAAGFSAVAFTLPVIGSITAGNLAAFGAMMALGGISQLITPTARANPTSAYTAMENPAARASFLYNGPANTMEQGGPVPVIYGRMRVGSTLLSASIQNEDLLRGDGSGEPL